MRNKFGWLKSHTVILICMALIASISAVMFWPLPCDKIMKDEYGDITVFVVSPNFSNTETLPTFSSEQWTVSKDSNVYFEILDVMGDYHCHRKILSITQNNHQPWISIYSESGKLIFLWMGTNDFNTEDTCYTVYGRGSGQSMMNAIHAILQNQQDIITK